jgi:hypothetical protein
VLTCLSDEQNISSGRVRDCIFKKEIASCGVRLSDDDYREGRCGLSVIKEDGGVQCGAS